jgi:phenylpyruvate tautomerase PptA (4-oxalocrotonate tautomerase family)
MSEAIVTALIVSALNTTSVVIGIVINDVQMRRMLARMDHWSDPREER